jgi:hypothetical protein
MLSVSVGWALEQNTIGLANPTKWGERETRPYALSEATKWLSGRTRVEHSPIPSPLTPPLENANEHVKLCL